MRVRVVSALLAVTVVAGCGESAPTAPPAPVSAEIVVETFSGTLPLRGSVFYSFSVATGGETSLTLVDARENGVITEALITIGLGVPRGTQCLASNVLSVKTSGTPQVRGQTGKGIHCAVVFDPGNLTTNATFSLNIVRPK